MASKTISRGAERKKKVVKKFAKLIDEHEVIAAVNVENLPAKQLMQLREQLRGKVHLEMTKKRIIKRAFKKSKKEGIEDLQEHLKGMPALLFTEENPFSLFKELKENKSPAPIKAGQEAPKDIVITAGPTSFAPGPIIGELGGLGVKAGIEGGKVAIKKDSVVAKEGDIITDQLAGILSRLEIFPMEIGLNITAVYENGSVLHKSVLDIDIDAIKNKFKTAHSNAFKLSIGANLFLKENMEHHLGKARLDALKLAFSTNILNSETINKMLGDAEMHATALGQKVSDKENQ